MAPPAGTGIAGRLGRRRFLQLGGAAGVAGLAAGTVWPSSAGASAIGLPTLGMASASGGAAATGTTTGVILVPAPTGVAATDTANVLAALAQAKAGTTVVLRANSQTVYVINQELPVPPGVRVTGYGSGCEQPHLGLIATLQQAPGVALKCILASAAYLAGLYKTAQYNNGTPTTTPDAAIEIDHIAFDGQNWDFATGAPMNGEGHGVVLFATGAVVHDCYFYSTAQASIVVADCNYAGQAATANTNENRIYDTKSMNAGSHGILVTRTTGAPSSLSGYMLNNVIESPSREATNDPTTDPATGVPYEAIHMDTGAGWWVVNNHAYACPGNGMYFGAPWGMWITGNAIDSFGCIPVAGKTYTGYHIDLAGQAAQFRPVLVNQNQLSACEGYDLYSPTAPGASNTYQYYVVTMEQSAPDNTAWIAQSGNSAHQNSQPPPPIAGAVLTSGSTTVRVPNGSTVHNVQGGMNVSDSAGLIPAGTTVVYATAGSSGQPDTIVLSNKATGSSSSDTLTFQGPTSVAWTYVNSLAGTTLNINRTNEIISGTIQAAPAVSGAGSVSILDPGHMAGGVSIAGTPSPNQVLMATSSTAATWAPLQGTSSGPVVTQFTASGTYNVPAGATQLRVTCVGGGGGGGGGGAGSTGDSQAGGAGGAAGTTSTQIVPVGSNTTLTVKVGPGGPGGKGGAAGQNNTGANGTAGTESSVTGTGILVIGSGGPGGLAAPGGTASGVLGAAYGGKPGQSAAGTTGGCGGSSGSGGGSPLEYSPGGGGGGGSASSALGGTGGHAGTAGAGGAAGSDGASSSTAGMDGESAVSPGGGGGGGGGSTAVAAGGQGGGGAKGYAIIEVVG